MTSFWISIYEGLYRRVCEGFWLTQFSQSSIAHYQSYTDDLVQDCCISTALNHRYDISRDRGNKQPSFDGLVKDYSNSSA